MFFLVEEAFTFVTNNSTKNSNNAYNFGLTTGFVFNQLHNSMFKNPEFFGESNYYYTFLTFYKFYNIDIFRSSFLFFENVRHSTKLEIV